MVGDFLVCDVRVKRLFLENFIGMVRMSQQEIELKMSLSSEQVCSVQRWLVEHSAVVGQQEQEDIYFDTTGQQERLFQVNDRGLITAEQSIRIRHSGTGFMLCVKKKMSESVPTSFKCSHEYEVSVGDGQQMAAILHAVGYQEKIRVRKKRTSYRYERVLICLDEVDDLGFFLELEVLLSSHEHTEHAQMEIYRVLRQMGISSGVVYRCGYALMLLNRPQELGISLSW